MTNNELILLQHLPLDVKIAKTKLRIREWVDYYGLDSVYVSFSGGKDSTVLLHIAKSIFPNIQYMYVDTGLEYPEIRQFVMSGGNGQFDIDTLDIVKPDMTFIEVIKKYGYPLVSKEVSKNIQYGRKALDRGDTEKYERYVLGKRKGYSLYPIPKRWLPLFNNRDIPVSNQCCTVMKKKPAHQYEQKTGRYAILGDMASDSSERKNRYLRNGGCNAFSQGRPISNPMGFWAEQDVFQYIREFNIDICSVYGSLVDNGGGCIKCSGVNRTGCVFCCFGLHLQSEPNKFQLLHKTHPKLWEYCMYNKNINLAEILDFLEISYK